MRPTIQLRSSRTAFLYLRASLDAVIARTGHSAGAEIGGRESPVVTFFHGARQRLEKRLARRAVRNRDTAVDLEFYRKYYPDLSDRSNAALLKHFVQNGRGEGRFPRADVLIDALEAEHGALPSDFSPEAYRANHRDLEQMEQNWELKAHYIRFGRHENRQYRNEYSTLEDDFYNLKISNTGTITQNSFELRFDTVWEMLDAARIQPGIWLNRFMPFEFALLNADWLERTPRSRMDGICLFLQHGLDRLAPIALAERFEPGFYRAIRPDLPSEATDADLYREWLGRGMPRGHPGSEAQALRRLIGEDQFPSCFCEVAYRAQLPQNMPQPGLGRLAALEHFITLGCELREIEFPAAPEAAHLMEQIGEHHLACGQAALAVKAFDRALEFKPGVGRIHHRRGDSLRLLNRTGEADADFLIAAQQLRSSVWSHIHAAEGLAARPSRADETLEWFLDGASRFRSLAPWRAMGHRLVANVFQQADTHTRALYAEGRRGEADRHLAATLDRLADAIRTLDPLPAPLPAAKAGMVLLVANRDLPQCEHYRVEQKRRQLEYGGWEVEIVDQAQADLCQEIDERVGAFLDRPIKGEWRYRVPHVAGRNGSPRGSTHPT